MGLRVASATLVCALAALALPHAPAWPVIPAALEPLCRLYLDPHDQFTRVVPPQGEGRALTSSAVLSNITVNYTGFTAPAQAAFEAAVAIWRTQISSGVPIVVDATFVNLGSTSLLGQAGFGGLSRNFPGAPLANVYYPGPIANKISNVDRNGSSVEIGASLNSIASWSYGTDGVPVAGKVDFISVVLHELGHGLGFVGTGSIASGIGSIGSGGTPYVYDAFVVDSASTSILNAASYPNGSAALASLLTGTGLSGPGIFWNGAGGLAANAGSGPPRLYSPSGYQAGSSYSHLNDATYPAGNLNSLMTPSIGSAEVIHTPGPIVNGMFADMGWGSQCSFGLNQSIANVAAAGGTVNVTLSTTTGCAWTASTASPFVTITAGGSGSASAVVRMTVTANAGAAARGATVTIGDQTLTIAQAGTIPCAYALNPAGANVGGGGAAGTVALTTSAGCLWTTLTSSAAVATVTPANGLGPATIAYTVSANPTGAARAATLTIGGQAFTITQAVGPVMSVDRPTLRFGAVNTGVAFTAKTGTQTVRLTQTGTGAVTWTASSAVPWLAVSPSSGSGPATLSLSALFAPGLAPTQTGTVTLTFTGAGNTVAPIAVTLASLAAPQAVAPTGAFDTPADGTAGVTGSIAVTGWALDDVEVSRVRILRDPVTGETPGVLVFVGDAVLVEGARSDVQALFPNHPRNDRAGWGYLLLTNFLPSLGNGTFRLTAVADDADGHSTTLGSKTITCANSAATAPFGAIDTPAQGQIVSGMINNFGWVLSAGTRRADVPGGGRVSVVIDGVVAGAPTSWTSRADLTALFAQAQFSGVTSSLAVFTLDTTILANGVHTISWLVTDNQGNASGVGSRYFTVSNGSGMTPSPVLRDSWLPPSGGRLLGRRGFNLDAPYREYTPDPDGRIAIQSEELDRLELRLEGVEGTFAGYLRVAGGLAPLPIGSHLDAATGTFTWHPGVGFVGTYDLVIGGRDVRIILNPKGSGRVGPQTVMDVADGGILAGWAADLDSQVDTGVDTLHVWAYPTDGGDPIFVGAVEYGGARPDVAAIYGERFLNSGYGIRVEGLAPGTYDLAVFAYSTVRSGFVPAKTVRVTVR